MARIYLLKGESDQEYRNFDLGENPLRDIIGPLGLRPEDREAAMPHHIDPEEPLIVVVSIEEEEAKETGLEPGYYRSAIDPHRAIRHCGIGLADILGAAHRPPNS